MTRPLAALIAVAALVAMPAAAPAKEVKSATVCGTAGCQSANDKAAVAAAVENGGPPTTPPRHGAAFYRVTMHIKGDPQPFRLLVAPGIAQVRGPDGTWFSLPDSAVKLWRDVVRGVRPLPAAKLRDIEPSAPPPVNNAALTPHTDTAAPRPATEPAGGTSWGLIAGITAAALALMALAALVARRRRREDPTGPRPAAAS
jgi:LPXTG-motif cell wall-anchored protein